MLGRPLEFILEDFGILPLDRVAFVIVLPVFGNFIDKKQRQYLDASASQAHFLVQVLLDGAADHLAGQRRFVYITISLARL